MAKAYQLTIEDKGSYLHFRVTGPNTAESEGPGLGLVDIFEIVTEGSERTWPHVRRLAYVDVNPAHSRPDMQFAETVAVNRGINMRLFCSVAEAEQWLLA